MKRLILLLLALLLLVGCGSEEEIIIVDNGYRFTDRLGQMIPVLEISVPNSKVTGNLDNFINTSKPVDVNPIFFEDSPAKTHRIEFSFDGVYPIDKMQITPYVGKKAKTIETMSIDVSLTGSSYERLFTDIDVSAARSLDFGGRMVRCIKVVFPADDNRYGLQDVRFTLADGVIVRENLVWSEAFHRYTQWTGADGIYAFNLTDGNDAIGATPNTTAFIFSDTYTGDVYEHNNLRKTLDIINNSLGYYNHNQELPDALTFDYPKVDGKARSVFLPDTYIGSRARNLLDGNGLSITTTPQGKLTNNPEGTMWLSETTDDVYLTIDLMDVYDLDSMYIWNYNAEPDYGVKSFSLAFSSDGENWTAGASYQLPQAGGSNSEAYHLEVQLDESARFLRLYVDESYSPEKTGLGKIMLFGEGQYLFGQVTASSEDTTLIGEEEDARLWLQDGVVIGNYFYVFPILIKNTVDFFDVYNVGMVKVPIVEERLDYENSVYLSTPLEVRTPDGGKIYYGAGVMNNVPQDGYIYIYGYKDKGGRRLVVARTLPEDIEDFNSWTFFDGEGFSHDINDSAPLIQGVSAELSVSYINTGMFAGKYMCVVMENTTSGKISYSISDTPWGDFGNWNLIYQTREPDLLKKEVSTYNAKMHPNLSTPGNFFITYNVNSSSTRGGQDGRICYPRVINMIEVKK